MSSGGGERDFFISSVLEFSFSFFIELSLLIVPSLFRAVGKFIPFSNMDHEWFINADSGPESGFGGARARNRTSPSGNPFQTGANTESGRGTAEGETPEPEVREDAVFNLLRQTADVMRMMREEKKGRQKS